MTREHLAIVSAVLTAVCVVPYLRDVHRGTTRPQRASWFVFAAVSVVASVSQLAAGGGAGAWLAAGSAVGFSAVFVVSIRHGVGGWSPVDRVVLLIAIAGVAASVVSSRALVAVVAVVAAEAVAIALDRPQGGQRPGIRDDVDVDRRPARRRGRDRRGGAHVGGRPAVSGPPHARQRRGARCDRARSLPKSAGPARRNGKACVPHLTREGAIMNRRHSIVLAAAASCAATLLVGGITGAAIPGDGGLG